jgi:hypothetical protein
VLVTVVVHHLEVRDIPFWHVSNASRGMLDRDCALLMRQNKRLVRKMRGLIVFVSVDYGL